MQTELWQSELAVIPMGQLDPDNHPKTKKKERKEVVSREHEYGTSISFLSRRLEIFLDNLCAASQSESSFLLSKRFAGIFSEPDEQIRKAILDLIEKLPLNTEEASSFLKLKDFLDSLCEGCYSTYG